MKQFIKTSILLLLAILLPAAATAYDFEVDGIYYNITSPNTVEVTYKDNNYTSYTGEVFIPSQVTYNFVNYNVTSIGDSAFYGYYHYYDLYLNKVTIPATVNSIGRKAFFGNSPLMITCLSLTPPLINDSFDNHDNFPYPVECDDGNNSEDECYYPNYNKHDCVILFVPSVAYQSYKELNENNHYFNWIYCIEWEQTESPSYTIEETNSLLGGVADATVNFTSTEDCIIYIRSCRGWGYSPNIYYPDDTSWIEGTNKYVYYESTCKPTKYIIQAYAVAEGKLPSDIVTLNMWLSAPYYTSFDLMGEGCFYSYSNNYSSDTALVLVSGSYWDPCTTEETHYYYSGDIEIPSSVNGYPVIGIADYAFKNCIDLISLYLPNTISFIGFGAFEGCSNFNRIILPVSITSFYYPWGEPDCCNLETVFLTGDGDWRVGALPEGLETLCIGSGVTGVKGMQVNPETIYSYATTPPVCSGDDWENDVFCSFTGYDAELHVPASSLSAYFTAPYWCNFTNIIGDAVAITDLTLNQDSVEILAGAQTTLRATVAPNNANPNAITWTSSDETVATVENGVITALKRGQCDIIANCQDKRVVCHVTVTEILPTSVTLNQENTKMEIGSQLTLTATVMPEDATDKTVSWRSSNQSVATVDENGVVTAVGTGECNITAYCHGKQAVCHVTVVEQFIYISLDQHEASVLPNHIIMLTPTVSPASTDLVVTSSNPAVAAARLAGNRIQVVGVSEGEATIVVNSADGYAFADSCQVRVYTERGDVNGDGFVDIADVSALIDYLLGGDASEVNEVNADTDANGDVGIADVSMLIDYLLGSTELPPKEVDGMVEYTVNGVTFKMVKVDGGTFTMGATEEEDADYQVFKGSPKHQVTLSKYWIGQTEVTQELWAAVMGSNPSTDQSNLQYPVNSISWEDCATFISQLNQLTGKQFRLPTEAEWEYAAKGGAKSMGYVYSGSDNLDEVAWLSTNSESRLHQVGTKKANELGLYDMCGNIDEWCNDWYSLYTADPVENPTGPETGMSRIHRGGRWNASAMYCRMTRRDGFAPGVTRNYLGLRLALTE